MNKNKQISVSVYVKRKYAYTKKEEELAVLAYAVQGRFVGGGTDLTTGKRDQQFIFKTMDNVKTFLDYPTVREAILTEVDVTEVD
jgi:hypothetical protein